VVSLIYSINDCTITERDPTLNFSQIVDCNELNQREKNRNKKKSFGRVKVKRLRFIFLLLVNLLITKISDVAAQIDLSNTFHLIQR
jgi:hypothetical protein